MLLTEVEFIANTHTSQFAIYHPFMSLPSFPRHLMEGAPKFVTFQDSLFHKTLKIKMYNIH